MAEVQQQSFAFLHPPAAPALRNRVIEAGAGTGKTTRIVRDVTLRLVEDAALRAERIVLMTFTEKAAAEIAERIRYAFTALGEQLSEPQLRWPRESSSPIIQLDATAARTLAVRTHLAQLDRLRSQTIHSFCQTILRAFPLEAGVDPRFEIIQGHERERLVDEVYERWLRELAADPSSELALAAVHDKFGYFRRLRDMVLAAMNRRELLEDASLSLGDISDAAPAIIEHAEIVRGTSAADCEKCDEAVALVEHLRANPLPQAAEDIAVWIEYFDAISPVSDRIDLRRIPKALRPSFEFFRELPKKLISHRAAVATRGLALSFFAALDREKSARGVLDFDDLLLLTARLLRDDEIAARVRARYDVLFVDEFQDTDRVQAYIVERLSRDRDGALIPGRVTLVGDPKQSIYSFRRADPETFARLVREFIAEGGERQVLDRQYRSDPELLRAVNAMFALLFPERDATKPDLVFKPSYIRLEASKNATRDAAEARLRFIGVPVGEDEERTRAEAEAVAEIIARGHAAGRPLSDFAVLLRKLTNAPLWADVFDRRGIAVALPPGRALLERRAVVDIMAVLRAIAYPFDQGAMISAARSPYFALSDDVITRALLQSDSEEARQWQTFAAHIRAYADRAEDTALALLIGDIIRDSEIETYYALQRNGARDLVYLQRFRAIAEEYDVTAGGSVRTFLEELTRRREASDEAEPRFIEEGVDAVHLMTVHASKGLEFDVVILPELDAQMGNDALDIDSVDEAQSLVFRHALESISAKFRDVQGLALEQIVSERDEAEVDRLFYVAVTRAKDEVIFVTPLSGSQKRSFWKPLSAIFQFDLKNLDALFPDIGERETRSLELGDESIPIEFEHIGVEQIDARSDRFIASDVAQRVANSVPSAPREIETVRDLFDRGEALRRVAAARRTGEGIATHRFLELWNFDARSIAATLDRVRQELALGVAVLEHLRTRADRIARSAALRRIRAAELLGREVPLFDLDERGVREGRIDLLLRENGSLLVVDFKTGERYSGRETKDAAQVREYCVRLSALHGEDCRGLLWYVDEKADRELVEV